MRLDHFDQYVLKQSGTAKEILEKVYNWQIGQNNAEKQLAGIRKHIRHKNKIGDTTYPTTDELNEMTVKGDGSITTKRTIWMSEEDNKNPARVMYLMGYDPTQWELVSCKTTRNDWDVTMKLATPVNNGDGKFIKKEDVHKETNHQYKCELSIKPIQDKINSQIIKEVFGKLEPPELIIYKYEQQTGLMVEIPVMDLHLGKLAWGDESGHNWNLKKAVKVYRDSIIEILESLQKYQITPDKFTFPIGQDFFHFDTHDSKTSNGTSMDTDTRWQKMFQAGIEELVWTIENMRQIAPVDILWTPGNHDKTMSFFATCVIDAWFKNDENVNVDISPTPRKYMRWGKCLIGFAHGQNEGKRIEKLMQIEAAKDWGETIFREFHLGHIHSEKVIEEGGVIIRHMSSITSADSWHKEMGFLGAIKKMQALVWSKDRGKILTIDVNTKMN